MQPGYDQADAARAAERTKAMRLAVERQAAEAASLAARTPAFAPCSHSAAFTSMSDRIWCQLAFVDERSLSFTINIL